MDMMNNLKGVVYGDTDYDRIVITDRIIIYDDDGLLKKIAFIGHIIKPIKSIELELKFTSDIDSKK